jgi:hypothetical protein
MRMLSPHIIKQNTSFFRGDTSPSSEIHFYDEMVRMLTPFRRMKMQEPLTSFQRRSMRKATRVFNKNQSSQKQKTV